MTLLGIVVVLVSKSNHFRILAQLGSKLVSQIE